MTGCRHVHYGLNGDGRVVPQGRIPGSCPWCGAGERQTCQLAQRDDELPPVLGEAIRQTTYDIHRRALCGFED
jgi:hypothetical protein